MEEPVAPSFILASATGKLLIRHVAVDSLCAHQSTLFKRASGYKPFLINTEIDMCRYFRKPYSLVSKTLMDLFLDFTNFNHTCPYVGDQIVDGFYLRPEIFKLPLPTGDYKLALGWYSNKKLQFDTNTSFQFVENLIDQ
ncbi:uncharacterized protein Dwil_GK26856 [Drosophila willistoni]|uniref:Uncharacterized protein n=1 Tax=Drosophila willistoni TaxID=7260 RepID=A0A0Q9WRD6_DROWI|nr:uncharacterized protein Dwil_GK26856 [Drosophila willistoni]